MTLLQLFTSLAGAMKEKVSVTYAVLLMVIGANLYQSERMLQAQDGMSKMVATHYAFDVVAFGLKDARNEEEMLSLVAEWKKMKWGAQVGGLTTICSIAPDRLLSLMSEETARNICRVSR